MVAEHELLGVRFEVQLSGQIGHVVHSNVMPQQRHRHDERHELAAVIFDRGEQLREHFLLETLVRGAREVY